MSFRVSALGMDVGVVGTPRGIALFEAWVASIRGTIAAPESGKVENQAMWPGFQSVFNIDWPELPIAKCVIDGKELSKRIRSSDRSEAIYTAVGVYEDALRYHRRNEETRPLLWFVVVPEEV